MFTKHRAVKIAELQYGRVSVQAEIRKLPPARCKQAKELPATLRLASSRRMPESAKKLALRKRALAAVACRKRRPPVKYPRAPRGRKPSRNPRPAPVWAPALFDDTGLPCSSCGHPFGRRGGMFRARGEPPCPWDVCLRCLQPMMAATQLLAGARPGVRAAAQRGSGRNVERRAALF